MAGKAHKELVFAQFLPFNLTRYAEDAEMLPLFQDLTYDEVVISDLVVNDTNPERFLATITSASRGFRGVKQEWERGEFNDTNGFRVLNRATPAPTLAEVTDLYNTPGAYVYMDGAVKKVVILGLKGADDAASIVNAKATFESAYLYEAAELSASVTVVGEAGDIVTDSVNPYMVGTIKVISVDAEKIIPATFYGKLVYPEIVEEGPLP